MKRTPLAHYIILLLILGLGTGAFLYVRPNVSLQLVIGIVTSIAYILWGIVHHIIQKNLHQKVVVEYLLIGAIAIVLLVTMLGF